jgi:hypothetical protein
MRSIAEPCSRVEVESGAREGAGGPRVDVDMMSRTEPRSERGSMDDYSVAWVVRLSVICTSRSTVG